MSENKTKPTTQDVRQFLNQVENPQKREDCLELLQMMEEITGEKPVMWGDSMVGFGHYHYKYDSGREGDSFIAGFAPRKQNLVVYIMAGFSKYPELMQQLGKYKTGSSCLYIKRLSDLDRNVLQKLIEESVKWMRERWPA